MALAATKCSWKRGSIAVSTLWIWRDQRLDLAAGGDVQERDAGAGAGGVAGGGDPGEVAVGDHAEHHRVLRARCARRRRRRARSRSTVSTPKLVHQQPRAGVERGLGELDGAHVALGDEDARPSRAVVQQVGVGAALGDAAVAAGLLGGADQAGGVDDAGEPHLGDHLDDAGAADAGDAAAVVGGNAGSSDQRSQPMTRKRGSRVAGSISTRSIAPGAARWPEEICAPSKAGPVGEEQASTLLAVAEQDLGVGADVDDQHQLVRLVRRLGERHGGGVGADVAGDAGQDVDAGVRVQAELDLLGPEVQRVGGGQRERGLAELDRVDAEQQVVHDRVADDHRLEDQLRARRGPRRRPGPTRAFSAPRTARVISAAPPGFIMA